MKIVPASLAAGWPESPPPCALQQHPCYGRAVAALGADVSWFAACHDGREVARVLVLRRRFGPLCVSWLARGPVPSPGAPAKTQCLAQDALLRHGKGLTLFLPDAEPQGRGLPALLTPQTVAEMDLTAPQPHRLAAQHGKWRNRLRHAYRARLDTAHRPLDPAADGHLLALEARQRAARRYSALPRAFTQAFATQGPDTTRLFLAHAEGTLAAFSLFLLHPPVATYHIAWTSPQGRVHAAHARLLWEAACWLAAQGFTRLDLGPIDTVNAPGLARFKLGSGARARRLGATCLVLPGAWPLRHGHSGAFPLAIPRKPG